MSSILQAQSDELLVWDTETTGLTLHPEASPSKQPRIIEFGGVIMSLTTGDIICEFNKLIHPGEAISEEITKITGITNDMVAHEGNFRERLPFIREVFGRCKSMCAHNLPFDRDVLKWELVRYRGDPLTENFPWPPRHHCTMNMYNPLYGRNPKLIELYEDITGKKHVQTHRAVEDVKMMVEVMQAERLWELMR